MHSTITMSPYGSLAPQGNLDPWWSRNLSTCKTERCRCKWAERLALARAALRLRCHDGSACLRRSVAFAATEAAEGKAKGCKQATHGITLASCRRRGDMRGLEPPYLSLSSCSYISLLYCDPLTHPKKLVSLFSSRGGNSGGMASEDGGKPLSRRLLYFELAVL